MTRCAVCRRRIWPWQRYGFIVDAKGKHVKWHAGCSRRIP